MAAVHYLQSIMNVVRVAQSLGTRTLRNGTQLIGRVPHVAPDAWLHIVFAPLPEPQIDALEVDIGLPFPENLRDFLNMCNGLSLFSGDLSIYGYRESYERTGDAVWQPFDIVLPNVLERLTDAKPSFLFVGGSPAGTGFYYFIDTADGRAYRCTRQSSKPIAQWISFPKMLQDETFRLAKLYDRRGRKLSGQPSG